MATAEPGYDRVTNPSISSKGSLKATIGLATVPATTS